MAIDLSTLPWWANLLIVVIGGLLFLAASTALWGLLLWLLFGRWWRALLTLALIGVAIWLGGPGRLWGVVSDGWGENPWVTVGVLSMIGIPIALLLGAMGFVSRVGGDRLRNARPGPATPTSTGGHFADYGSENQQWQRELRRRDS